MDVEKYYENYIDLFQQEGWMQLLDELKEFSDSIKIESLSDARDLHLAQGRLDVLRMVLSWEDSIKNSYVLFLQEETSNETFV